MLNKNNLRIAKFCVGYESRYVLNGLHITPNETVVTDGFRLVRVSSVKPREKFDPFTVDQKTVMESLKNGAGDGPLQEKSFRKHALKGKFPKWKSKKVIPPKKKSRFSILLDAKLLHELLQDAAKFRGSDYPHVEIRFYGKDKPVRIDTHNRETGQDWTAALMPVRYYELDEE